MARLDQKQYAFGALVKGHKLDLIEYMPPALGPNDVFVDLQFCGMCHSCVHPLFLTTAP